MRLRSLLHPLGADPKGFVLSFFPSLPFPSLPFPFLSFSSFCTKKITRLGESVRVRLIVELCRHAAELPIDEHRKRRGFARLNTGKQQELQVLNDLPRGTNA